MDVLKKLKKSQLKPDLESMGSKKDGHLQIHLHPNVGGSGTPDGDTVFEGSYQYGTSHGFRYTKGVMRQYMVEHICPACQGQRLNPTALSVQVGTSSPCRIVLLVMPWLAKSLTF